MSVASGHIPFVWIWNPHGRLFGFGGRDSKSLRTVWMAPVRVDLESTRSPVRIRRSGSQIPPNGVALRFVWIWNPHVRLFGVRGRDCKSLRTVVRSLGSEVGIANPSELSAFRSFDIRHSAFDIRHSPFAVRSLVFLSIVLSIIVLSVAFRLSFLRRSIFDILRWVFGLWSVVLGLVTGY